MPTLFVAAIKFSDLLELAPILLPVGLWVLARLAAVVRGMNGAPPGRPQPRPPDVLRDPRRGPVAAAPVRPHAAGPRPAPAGGERLAEGDDPTLELARQIEEFIARGRGTAPRRPPPQQPPAPRPAGTRRRESKPADRAGARPPQRPAAATKPPSPPAPPKDLGRLPTDVTSHVEKAFRPQEPGGLAATQPAAPAVAEAPQHPVVAELVAAIRDPRALQRMILVREILDRPVDRW